MNLPPILNENATPDTWPQRKAEIVALFSQHVYGHTPAVVCDNIVCRHQEHLLLANDCVKDSYMLFFTAGTNTHSMRFHVYTPAAHSAPLPCVLMLNPFSHNADVPHSAQRTYNHLPYDLILAEGYAAVAIEVDDLGVDDAQQFANGLLQLAPRTGESGWGAIGMWAWGASRVIDWLCTQAAFDGEKIAVMGCSRAGKTALWCAAQDARVSLVISNVSGCTGAALTRGKQGEHIRDITKQFPHWMCEKYATYAEQEDALPVDQHMLLAACAPRPLYVSSAIEDDWADPCKEFEACVLAGEAYRALGASGLSCEDFPSVDHPVQGGDIAYHVRTGAHGCTVYDWQQYLNFIRGYF